MENKISIKKLLFNPFEYIAGTKALIIGSFVILVGSALNYFANRPFTDIIDWGLLRTILESVAGWILFSLLLFIIGLIFSKSKIRFVDVLGTQALARIPNFVVILVTFIPIFKNFVKFLIWKTLGKGEAIEMTTLGIVFSLFIYIIVFAALIWSLVLMFNAFKVSTNLKGEKSVWLFVAAIIFSIVVSLGVRLFVFGM